MLRVCVYYVGRDAIACAEALAGLYSEWTRTLYRMQYVQYRTERRI